MHKLFWLKTKNLRQLCILYATHLLLAASIKAIYDKKDTISINFKLSHLHIYFPLPFFSFLFLYL